MSKYPFSQLITRILSKLQGLRAKQYANIASERNAGDWQNSVTRMGGATFAEFVVAPHPSMIYTSFVAPRIQASGRSLQLRNKGI